MYCDLHPQLLSTIEGAHDPIISSSRGLAATHITVLGATLGAFTYGLATCLYTLIMYLRVSEIRRSSGKSCRYSYQNTVLTVYTSIMFALVTVGVYESNQLLWRLIPSTPGGSFDNRFVTEAGIGVTGAYTSAINSWMADTLLVSSSSFDSTKPGTQINEKNISY